MADRQPRQSRDKEELKRRVHRGSPVEIDESIMGVTHGEESTHIDFTRETALKERVPMVSTKASVPGECVLRVSPGESVPDKRVFRESPEETVQEESVPRESPEETVLEESVTVETPDDTALEETVPNESPCVQTLIEERVPRISSETSVLEQSVANMSQEETILEEHGSDIMRAYFLPEYPEESLAVDLRTSTDVVERQACMTGDGLALSERRERQQTHAWIYAEILEQKISKTKQVFVKTEKYGRVDRILKEEGHVTLSGASGEGKTSLALMLGVEYHKHGYDLVFVNDVDRFRLEDHLGQGRKIFLIFDDIFGTVGLSTDVPQLRRILHDVQLCLKERNSGCEKIENSMLSTIHAVFTTKTYNLECGMSKLEGQEYFFFKGRTVIDFTTMKSYRYSDEDKENIFQKHKLNHGSTLGFGEASDDGLTMFGFPLTCELFFDFEAFQHDPKSFFKEPLFYLRRELKSILTRNNERSAALILMILCDGKVDLSEVENEKTKTIFEELFISVKSIVPIVTGAGIAGAARTFRGTFFTSGDIIEFSHPIIYDACACELFKISARFILENCSMKFLYERLKEGSMEAASVSDHLHVIYVSEAYYDVIAQRLARAVEDGIYSMSVTHPILQKKEIVDRMFELLKLRQTNVFDRMVDTNKNRKQKMLHLMEQDKYLLHWAVHSHSPYLVQKVLEFGYKFSVAEIADAFEACASCGNLAVLKFLMSKYHIHNIYIYKALKMATENVYLEMVRYLSEYCKNVMTSNTTEKHDMMNNRMHEACAVGSVWMIKIYTHFCDLNNKLYGFTPVLRAAFSGKEKVFDWLVQKEADLTIKTNNGNHILHLASAGGNTYIVDKLLPLFDINVSGQNGWTPAMCAAFQGQQDVFDLLVSEGADLTQISDNGDNILHVASKGGNTYIVDKLLPLFDINVGGEGGSTPVIAATYKGQKDVFHLFVSKEADLTQKSNNGDNILHVASIGGNTYIVDKLLPWFDINVRGQGGYTPVMWAAYKGQTDVFDLLVSKGSDLTQTDNNGDNIFHVASIGGNTYIVNALLPLFDINVRGQGGYTPVMWAAYKGQRGIFDLLVSKGANLSLKENDGNNILHIASAGGNTYIVNQLLPLFDINVRAQDGWTPVMLAAYKGQKDVFDLFVSNGADLNQTNSNGDNIMHVASMGGNIYIVEQLLELFDINVRGQNGWTPVMWAAHKGQKDVFDRLVSEGADLTSSNGNDILHLASGGGNTYIVDQLLPLFDINVRGHNDWTPIMYAASKGQKDVFDHLLSKEADLTLTNNYGNNVLHVACMRGNTCIVDQLLPLFDINVMGQNGYTPVMWAADQGQKDVFDLLVSQEGDLTLTSSNDNNIFHVASMGGNTYIIDELLLLFDINIRGQNGYTPVMFAAYKSQKNVFDLLVSKGADLTLTSNNGNNILHLATLGGNTYIVDQSLPLIDINARGENGYTPVMWAADKGQRDVFDLLASKGADITLTSSNGNNILHIGTIGGNTYIVEQLLRLFDINVRGNSGYTPVMWAADKGQKDVFDLLVSKRADLTLTNNNGDNILHVASSGSNTYIVERLLPLFDINVRGQDGYTPVMWAADKGQRDVFDLLASKGADLTLTSNNGSNLLHVASAGGNTYIVEQLLPLFDINVTEQNDNAPVMWAAYKGQKDVFDLLVSKGADLTLTSNNDNNILHLGTIGGNTYIVEQLLRLFDINVRGNSGYTPVMWAADKGQKDVFDLLVSKGADLTLTDNNGKTILHHARRGCNEHIVDQCKITVSII